MTVLLSKICLDAFHWLFDLMFIVDCNFFYVQFSIFPNFEATCCQLEFLKHFNIFL